MVYMCMLNPQLEPRIIYLLFLSMQQKLHLNRKRKMKIKKNLVLFYERKKETKLNILFINFSLINIINIIKRILLSNYFM